MKIALMIMFLALFSFGNEIVIYDIEDSYVSNSEMDSNFGTNDILNVKHEKCAT